ncbi:MAG: DUF934 domain-containing protein [Pigmentiphaga sp.]
MSESKNPERPAGQPQDKPAAAGSNAAVSAASADALFVPSGPVLHAPNAQDATLATDLWQWPEASAVASLAPDVAAVVPLESWLEHGEAWRGQGARRGVRLVGNDDAKALTGQLMGLGLIAIEFPIFNDGRGFSAGRHLRQQLGWNGEMRAIGDILVDTVNYLARCGFDSFQLKPGHAPELAREQLQLFPRPYQRGYRPLSEAA